MWHLDGDGKVATLVQEIAGRLMMCKHFIVCTKLLEFIILIYIEQVPLPQTFVHEIVTMSTGRRLKACHSKSLVFRKLPKRNTA